MLSKKKQHTNQRRTSLPRIYSFSKSFIKDWSRLERSGRYDMRKLKHVMLLLIANDTSLGAEWRDHALVGQWTGYRECHIGGDFLLIYRVEDNHLSFVRTGTHAELFD